MSRGVRRMSDRLRIVLEQAHHPLNGFVHLDESGAQSVGIIPRWRFLARRYVDGEIGIAFEAHARFPTVDEEVSHLVIVFEKAIPSDREPFESGAGRDVDLGVAVAAPRSEDVQSSMAVQARPIAKDLEMVRHPTQVLGEVSSVARLYRLNDGPVFVREWRDLPTRLLPLRWSPAHRELQSLFIGWRILAGSKDGGVVDGGVQGGAELIQQLAEKEAEQVGHPFIAWDDPHAPVPAVVYPNGNVIGLLFKEIGPLLTKLLVVDAGPVEPRSGVIEHLHPASMPLSRIERGPYA